MISAFGVTHVIEKSYVPGVGYKAAKTLDATERHIVRNATLGAKAARKKGIKKPQSGRTKIWESVDSPRGKLTRVFPQFSRSDTGAAPGVQGFSRPNGRGGGDVIIHRDATDGHATYRHEMAHIAPRRNPVRMQDRLSEPVRRGREEGRADFIAHSGQSTGSYPGSDDFKRGYNEVQGRMAAAKFRSQLRRKS